jgi:hypothetical protein
MTDKQKSYNIKVLVFTTTVKDNTKGLFGKITYSDMLDF